MIKKFIEQLHAWSILFYFSKKWSHDRREETIFNYGIGIRNEIAVSGVSLAGRGRGWSIREITDVRILRYGFYVRKLRTQLKPLLCQVAAATTGKLFEFRIEGGSEARRWNVNSLSLSLVHFRPPSSIRPLCTKRKLKFCIVDVLRIPPLCARSAIMPGYYHRFRSLSSRDNHRIWLLGFLFPTRPKRNRKEEIHEIHEIHDIKSYI